ncbi:MAG: metallophosphoesterase [Planctomycetes bacterium]|nr:metallophosphoesterase [Planctomycetota bacterium]
MASTPINTSNPDEVCEVLIKATKNIKWFPGRLGCTHHLPDRGKVLVTGDLHNNQSHLAKIIELADLDTPTNHLVLQELIHSGNTTGSIDLSYQMLVNVANLIVTYPTQVHPILANHELSQTTGRAITKGSGELVEQFIHGVRHVFKKRSDEVLAALDDFIVAMPIAVQSKSGLLCVHSLPNELSMDEFDVDILDKKLTPSDYCGSFGSAFLLVWGRQYSQEQIDELADYWDVSLFCLGHAWVPDGIEAILPNVLRLNSDHEKGVALPIELDTILDAQETIKSAIPLSSVPENQNEL